MNNHDGHMMMGGGMGHTDSPSPVHNSSEGPGMKMMMMKHEGAGNMSGHDMMGMKMYFHAGVAETILFECWRTNSALGMIMSCLGVFFLGMAYEALKSFRSWLAQKMAEDEKLKTMMPGAEKEIRSYTLGPIKLERGSPCRVSHLLQTILHVVQLVLSYALMLIFMTFNVWLCIAVALGSGVGYFCFGWITFFHSTTSDHCG